MLQYKFIMRRKIHNLISWPSNGGTLRILPKSSAEPDRTRVDPVLLQTSDHLDRFAVFGFTDLKDQRFESMVYGGYLNAK